MARAERTQEEQRAYERALADHRRRWRGEFQRCVACDRPRWRYSLTPAPRGCTWGSVTVRKGALVCYEHRTIHDPKAVAALKELRNRKGVEQ